LGEVNSIKKRLSIAILAIAIVMLTLQVLPVLAQGLTPHAKVKGYAYMRRGCRRRPLRSRCAVMTFWSYDASGSLAEHPTEGWAITLKIRDKTFVWHVVNSMPYKDTNILLLKAVPHPGVGGLIEPRQTLWVALNHDPANPFVIAKGRGVFFAGKALVPIEPA
jgi:hypothetical protein